MKWNYILFLPALVSIVWALATMLIKKRPTWGQLLLCLAEILVGFSITVFGIYLNSEPKSLFIYNYMFEAAALFCVPTYYIGLCALTEPRGATLWQRRIYIIPLLFVLALTIGAFQLGPRRYNELCLILQEGTPGIIAGDHAWNYMFVLNQIIFPALLLLTSIVILTFGTIKVYRFERRFNSFYAAELEAPQINIKSLVISALIFLPLAVLAFSVINYRPHHYKYLVIACTLMLTVLLFTIGHLSYRLDHDARQLAQYIKDKNNQQ